MCFKKSRLLALYLLISFFGLQLCVSVVAISDDTDPVDPRAALQNSLQAQLDAGAGVSSSEKGGPMQDPRYIVAYVIRTLLTFLGIILTVLLLMSGYWFFTAHGEAEKVTKAMGTAKRAIFGLIIIILSYSITVYIMRGIELVNTGDLGQATETLRSQYQ